MTKVMMPFPLEAVTILGLGESAHDWVNFTHETFDRPPDHQIWTINAGVGLFYHDMCFDMHTEEYLALVNHEPANRRREWMKKHDRPIVMAKAVADIPTSFTYPLKHVSGMLNSTYFLTGPAYIFAFALACGVKRMRIYGMDFTNDEGDYHPGRACAEFWLGQAVGRGVKVEITSNTDLLGARERKKGTLYGFHEPLVMENGLMVSPDYMN
jgi:hypothetical protein